MVTSRDKYNPIYHSNIPSNFRYWHRQTKSNVPLPDDDEVLFNLWRDLYCVTDDDIEDKDNELYILMLDACLDLANAN